MEEKLNAFETNWKEVNKIINKMFNNQPSANKFGGEGTTTPIDFDLRYFSHRLRGHVFMEFRQFKKSLKYYRKAKSLCEKYKKY